MSGLLIRPSRLEPPDRVVKSDHIPALRVRGGVYQSGNLSISEVGFVLAYRFRDVALAPSVRLHTRHGAVAVRPRLGDTSLTRLALAPSPEITLARSQKIGP